MPEEYDLEKLKLKTADQLDDAQRNFIIEHRSELNEEDEEAYASFLNVQEDDGNEDSSTEQSDTTTAAANTDTSDDESNNGEEEKPVQESKPSFSFQSEEEAKEFVKNLQKEQEEEKQKAIDAAKTPEEKRYVEENWKPQDWNEGIKTAVKIAKEEIKAEQQEEQRQAVATRLQQEWETLSKEKGLPSDKTPEGKAIHDSIVRFGIAANKQTFTDAYEVWSQVPKAFGGGLEVAVKAEGDKAEQDKKKEQVNKQKKVAAKIGGQNDGQGAGKAGNLPTATYEQAQKAKSTDQLLKELGYI